MSIPFPNRLQFHAPDAYPDGWIEASVANSGNGLWLPAGIIKATDPPTKRELRRQRQLVSQMAASFGKFFTSTNTSAGNPGRGMSKPMSAVNFAALRALSYSSQIDILIINAIKAAARRFGQICDVPGKQKGFRVVHRRHLDPDFDAGTPDIKRRCAEMEEMLKRPTNPPHPTFMDFLLNSLHEQLVLDRRCVVLPKDRAGRIGSYHLVDGACYTDDTEVLTRAGWKRFQDVDMATDEFATRNQQTRRFEWQRATYFHQEDWDGDVVRFTSRSLDLTVTPNHRMVATIDRDHRYERIVQARDLLGSRRGNWQLPATSEWGGERVARFVLAKADVRARGVDIDGDDFAAFMGMWLAEGSKGGNQGGNTSTIVVSQKCDSKGFVEYRALLTRILGREPSYNGKVFTFKNKTLRDYLAQFGGATEKFVPETIKNMPPEQLAIFWRYYMLGDGHYECGEAEARKGATALGFVGRQRICTSSRRMADDLQEVAQKLGYSASVTPKMRRDVTMSDGRVILAENCKQGWVVSLRTTKYQSFSTESVHYSGKVYCVSVPNEVLYVRRNGLPVWCGNTVQPVIEVLAPWMRDHGILSEDEARFKMQVDLWAKPPADPRTGAPVNVDLSDAAYVQVIEGRVVGAWKDDEIYVGIANSTIAIDHAFYGTSPLEFSLYLSLLFGKALRFNANLFDVTFPEGILAITGDYDEEGVEAFKRAALDFDPDEASSRLPVITGDKDTVAQLINLRESPQDMKMVEMIRMLANFKCAAYRVHPSIINVTDEGGGINIGNTDDGAIEQAIGDGFHGLMVEQANLLTNAIVAKQYDDLIVIVDGLDEESEQQILERLQIEKSWKTLNEVRVSRGLAELPEELPSSIGDFVADPSYMQIYQVLAGQQQQQQQQDMGAYEQGDFGQGAEGDGQPWGASGGPGGPGGPGGSELDDDSDEKQGRQDAVNSNAQAGNNQAMQPAAPQDSGRPFGKSRHEEGEQEEVLTIRLGGTRRAIDRLLATTDDDEVF